MIVDNTMALSVTVDQSATDAERAKEITRGAYCDASDRLPVDRDIAVELDWTDDEFVTGMMNGVAGFTPSADRVTIEYNSTVEGWEETLRASVAHEHAHTQFLDAVGSDELEGAWQYVLFEAQSQTFAERVYPDIETPWREHVGHEVLEELWPEIRDERLDDDEDEAAELFFGSEDVPHWLGYGLSYRIGGELLDEHEVDEFPELGRSDVVAAGDAVFG